MRPPDLEPSSLPPLSDPSTVVVLGPHVVLSCSRTAGVPLFQRCPPVHSVILGRCRFEAVERRLLRALEHLELEDVTVTEAAARVDPVEQSPHPLDDSPKPPTSPASPNPPT